MTSFDIIKSKDISHLNLSSYPYLTNERIINIMKFLHKLDERNPFKDLPNEVVTKIFSELDCKDILSICNLSKQFKYICDNDLIPLLKLSLSNKGIYVENINSKNRLINICKNIGLNKRIYDEFLEGADEGHKYIVGTNGKVYTTFSDFNEEEEKDIIRLEVLENVNDIISMSGNDNGEYLFLRNDGHVYGYGVMPYDNKSLFNDPASLVLKSEGKYLDDIIQVIQDNENAFFLTSKGKVYVHRHSPDIHDSGDLDYDYPKIISGLDNIIEIVTNDKQTLFLQKNGNVYKLIHSYNIIDNYGAEENYSIKQIETFKNIKQILMSNFMLVTLTYDNILDIYNNDLIPFAADSIKNIDKVKLNARNLSILTIDGKLYNYHQHYDGTHSYILKVENLVDFIPLYDDTYVLTKNNKLFMYIGNILDEIKVNGNIQILDDDLILVNNILYYINKNDDVIEDKFVYDLVKVD